MTRGQPREQYPRTVVLLPPEAGQAWIRALATVWEAGRFTVGGSADDGGIGDLDVRIVLAINSEQWGDLAGFYQTHYPGVVLKNIHAVSPADAAIQLLPPTETIAMSQQDPRWAADDLGEAPGGWTIGQKGCFLTNKGMMLRRVYGTDVTPPILNQLFKDNGIPFVNDDTLANWAEAVALFHKFDDSIKADGLYSADRLRDLQDTGWEMLLRVAGGDHYVLLDYVLAGVVHVLDPWTGTRRTWPASDISGIRAAHVRQEPIPDPVPPTPDPINLKLGAHVLAQCAGLQEYIDAGAPMKFAGEWGSAALCHPGQIVIGRVPHTKFTAQSEYEWGFTPQQAAVEFLDEDGHVYQDNPAIRMWEGHNEPVWTTADEMTWYADFEIERMKLMEELDLRCVIGNFSSGCPPLEMWPCFLPACKYALKHGHWLGLHEYGAGYYWWMTGNHQLDPTEDEGDTGWTTLRYRKAYRQYLEPAGLGGLPLAITETGLDPLVSPRPPDYPQGTWKELCSKWASEGHQDCDQYYFDQLRWYEGELMMDSFVKAAFVFCWGHLGDAWAKFDVAGTKVGDLLIKHAESVDPEPDPEPDPDPDPPGSFPIRGVHDLAGAEWMRSEGLKGWCLEPLYLGTDPKRIDGLDRHAAAGIRVILNLRYSYAVDDGGMGTMPLAEDVRAYEDACVQTMRLNPAAWGFVYSNEMNNPREWPKGGSIEPLGYAASYNEIWQQRPAGVRLSPGAIDPFNPGWGDWRVNWKRVLEKIEGADFLALHTYCHGSDPALVEGAREFGDDPLKGVYYDLRVLESQKKIVPARFAGLPILVTETNHLLKLNGDIGWDDAAGGVWVREAFRYFEQQGVAGACLFRFNFDQWRWGDLDSVKTSLAGVV